MSRLHEKRVRYAEFIQKVRENAPPTSKHTPTNERLVLYHMVVEALVPGHGVTDDDPERAVADALDNLAFEAMANCKNHELRVRALELSGEVRES